MAGRSPCPLLCASKALLCSSLSREKVSPPSFRLSLSFCWATGPVSWVQKLRIRDWSLSDSNVHSLFILLCCSFNRCGFCLLPASSQVSMQNESPTLLMRSKMTQIPREAIPHLRPVGMNRWETRRRMIRQELISDSGVSDSGIWPGGYKGMVPGNPYLVSFRCESIHSSVSAVSSCEHTCSPFRNKPRIPTIVWGLYFESKDISSNSSSINN